MSFLSNSWLDQISGKFLKLLTEYPTLVPFTTVLFVVVMYRCRVRVIYIFGKALDCICYTASSCKGFVMSFFSKSHTGLYYCQKDEGDAEFQKFCTSFLPKHLDVKELDSTEPFPGRVFLVLFLPTVNRQNNVDVLTNHITQIMEKHNLREPKDIRLIQISFDGNNSSNPPNLMNNDIFERLESNLGLKIKSFINIIYTDLFHFKECAINRSAVNELQRLLKNN